MGYSADRSFTNNYCIKGDNLMAWGYYNLNSKYTNCTPAETITNQPGLPHGTYDLQTLLKNLKTMAHTNDGGGGVTPSIPSGTYDLHDLLKKMADVAHTNTITNRTNTCLNCYLANCNCDSHSH